LNPIHEGTHGIQALDLLGRKVVMQDGLGLDLLLNLIQASTAQAAESPELAEFGAQLDAVVFRLADVTRKLHGTGQPALTLANAAVYLEAFGHTVVAWIWLEQMLAAAGKSGDFYAGKQQTGRWFFAWELPKTEQWLNLLASLDDSCLTMRDNWF